MKLLQWALTGAAFALLGGGYAMSQVAYFQGRAAAFAKSIDQPPIAALSAVILVGSILLYAFRREESN